MSASSNRVIYAQRMAEGKETVVQGGLRIACRPRCRWFVPNDILLQEAMMPSMTDDLYTRRQLVATQPFPKLGRLLRRRDARAHTRYTLNLPPLLYGSRILSSAFTSR